MDNSKNLDSLIDGDNIYLIIDSTFGWSGIREFVKVSDVRDGQVFFENYPMFRMKVGDQEILRDGYHVGHIDHRMLGWSDEEVAEKIEKDEIVGDILESVETTDLASLSLEKLKQIANILATP